MPNDAKAFEPSRTSQYPYNYSTLFCNKLRQKACESRTLWNCNWAEFVGYVWVGASAFTRLRTTGQLGSLNHWFGVSTHINPEETRGISNKNHSIAIYIYIYLKTYYIYIHRQTENLISKILGKHVFFYLLLYYISHATNSTSASALAKLVTLSLSLSLARPLERKPRPSGDFSPFFGDQAGRRSVDHACVSNDFDGLKMLLSCHLLDGSLPLKLYQEPCQRAQLGQILTWTLKK